MAEPNPKKQRLLRRLLALGVGALLTTLLLELGLRVSGAVPIQLNPLSGFHVPHARLGWLGVPEYSARFRRPDFDVLVKSCEQGFRLPAQGSRGERDASQGRGPRLAFLGDSFTWGWGVEQGELFSDRLQRLVGDQLQLENYGVNAFGTGQQLLLFRELLAEDAPDVVTLMFCYNDLRDNQDRKGGKRPWFELQGGQLLTRNYPVERRLSGPVRDLMRHSLALAGMRYGLNRIGRGLRELREPAQVLAAGSATPEDVAALWGLQRAILRELKAECARAGSELRVVYVSAPFDVAGTDENRTGHAGLDYRTPMAQLCAELEIAYFDPTEGLRELWSRAEPPGERGEPYFFAHDEHWTAAGHAAVAELLFASKLWVPPAD